MRDSCRLRGVEQDLQPRDLVAQGQPTLLEATQHQFVLRHLSARAVDQGVEIGVFHAQFDQAARGRMQVGVQGVEVGGRKGAWG